MSAELIINCKVACRLMRMRDNVLFLLSWILWATMILALYHTEFKGFVSLAYVSVVATVAGAFFLWSHFRKAVFRYSKRPDRRSGHPRLTPAMVAGYFGMEEERLRAMQQERYTSIQHLQDGHVMAVSPPHQVQALVLVPKKFNVRLRAAA